MKKEFKVRNRDNGFYIRVIVYDSISQMRKDADKHNTKSGLEANNKDTLGVSHHYVREKVTKDGKLERLSDCGTIRFSKKHLSTEIVAHELVHASMWIYRLKYGTDRDFEGSVENADFGNSNSELEETYAHIYGQMFRDMTRKLYKYDLWK